MDTTHRNPARTLLFGLIATISGVLVAEVLLLVLSLVPPVGPLLSGPEAAPTLPDDALGLRPNPAFRDHDHRGFRNAEGIERADVVALGDSQTYGTGVPRDAAWPIQIGTLTGVVSYNMGFPGYSPLHGLVLLDDALSLGPRVVVQSIYTGNDLWDSYDFVYGRGQLPELLGDESRRRSIDRANANDPLEPHLERLARAYRQATFSVSANDRPLGNSTAPGTAAFHGWLSARSRTYVVGWKLYLELERRRRQRHANDWTRLTEIASRSGGLWERFEAGDLRTIFVPRYRLVAVDVDDVRIGEGLRLIETALHLMRDRVAATGAQLVVVLIPTKMLVFDPLVVGAQRSVDFDRLVVAEQRLLAAIREAMTGTGVVVVDALPNLQRANGQGLRPYALSQDGHPTAAGHHAIAQALASPIVSSLVQVP